MIDDATLERGLRARPPADPAYRSRITEAPPTAIRPRTTETPRAEPRRTRSMLTATSLVAVIVIAVVGAFLLSVGGGPRIPSRRPVRSRVSRPPSGSSAGTTLAPGASP